MKLKDIDSKTDITNIKIKLTPSLKEAYNEYLGPYDTDEVYIVGNMMGDFFISTEPPTPEKRNLFPMPIYHQPKEFLECEILT